MLSQDWREVAVPLVPLSHLQSLQKVKAALVPEEGCRHGGWGLVRVALNWGCVVRVPTAVVTRLERKPRLEKLPGGHGPRRLGNQSDSLRGVGRAGEDKNGAGHLPALCQPTLSLPLHWPTGHQLAHCPQ